MDNVKSNPQDNYWGLVNAAFAQVQGMYQDYLNAIINNNRSDLNLTFQQFYVIPYMDDLFDVMAKFIGVNMQPPHCSFLLKMTNDSIYAAHDSWTAYINLLRIYKIINLNLHNPLVKTKRMLFSSDVW